MGMWLSEDKKLFICVFSNIAKWIIYQKIKNKIQSTVQVFAYKSVSAFKVFNQLPFSVLHAWLYVTLSWSRSRCTSCKDYLRIICFLICSVMWTVKKISLFFSVALVWFYSLGCDFRHHYFYAVCIWPKFE